MSPAGPRSWHLPHSHADAVGGAGPVRGTVWGPLAPGEDSAVCCVASSSSRAAAGPRGGQGRVWLSFRAQLRAVWRAARLRRRIRDFSPLSGPLLHPFNCCYHFCYVTGFSYYSQSLHSAGVRDTSPHGTGNLVIALSPPKLSDRQPTVGRKPPRYHKQSLTHVLCVICIVYCALKR